MAGPPRRIAFVLPSLNSGGAERAALNLAAATPRSSCVVVAEVAGGDLAADPLASNVLFASHRLVTGGRIGRIARLVRVLRRLRPDLVVSMLSPLVSTAAGSMAQIPVMHWLQAPWSRTTAAGRGGLVPATQRLALRMAGRRSQLVAAATPGLLEECLTLGFSPGKLALLPNGLVLPPFPVRSSYREGSLIVTVGRLEPPKRHDLLLEAVASIATERELELVLVGSGAHKSELKERARTLGIAERVTFTGFVHDPHRYISSADVFALATDHEGFGNVVVEALACGVPTVVSDVPYGPRFILGTTRIGRLVKPGSAAMLAEALRLALDRAPTDEERAEGRRRAEDFSIDRVAARFEEIIDHILDGGNDGAWVSPPTSWP
jgi:glycosyltransferase involved in cell wall biosynthesis